MTWLLYVSNNFLICVDITCCMMQHVVLEPLSPKPNKRVKEELNPFFSLGTSRRTCPKEFHISVCLRVFGLVCGANYRFCADLPDRSSVLYC
jgi:hypothetical protein